MLEILFTSPKTEKSKFHNTNKIQDLMLHRDYMVSRPDKFEKSYVALQCINTVLCCSLLDYCNIFLSKMGFWDPWTIELHFLLHLQKADRQLTWVVVKTGIT